MPFDHFPTPNEIAPEVVPPLDQQWVEVVMQEISATIRRKQPELQARKIIRYKPSGYYHTGHAAAQWKYHAKHIAALVRERGWTVAIIENGTFPCLDISMPHRSN